MKLDLNLVYYLLSAYVNIDFVYLEIKQFNHRNWLNVIVFLITCFVLN